MRRKRQTPGFSLIAWTALSLGLGVVAPVGTGSAEPPAVEHKRIPPDMAEEVEAAVRKAAQFLRGTQEADGGWTLGDDPPGTLEAKMYAPWRPAFSCMVGIALARAGVRQGDPPIEALTKYLTQALSPLTTSGSRSTFLAKTYGAAAFLWFLAEARSPALRQEAVAATLAITGGAAEKGLWGYELPDVRIEGGYGRVKKLSATLAGHADLSNSQFAILGMLSAERLGVLRADVVWGRVREAFKRAAMRDGAYPYQPWSEAPDAYRTAYRAATACGAASLYAALRRTGSSPEEAIADGTVRKALRWLESRPIVGKDGALDVAEPGDAPVHFQRPPFWTLIAIERLGAFTGLERLAGAEWYRVGAKRLLATQSPDGSWPSTRGANGDSRAMNAALSIIFLTRAADQMPVTTPETTPADVAGLATVPEPVFSDVLSQALRIASRDAVDGASARPWRDAFFAAGTRVVGALVSRMTGGSDAERAYVKALLPDLVEGGPSVGGTAATAAEWRTWYEANGQRILADPATRRFRAPPK